MRKTKIVCTIGPASEHPEVLEKLILSGMNVARLNFSHGTYEEHHARIKSIRACSRKLGRPIAIMLDTKGPEIRTGILRVPFVNLEKGDRFILTTENILGNQDKVSVSYKQLPKAICPGAKILLDDGLIELVVEYVDNQDIHCRVVNGGILKSNKGINLPNIDIDLPSITEKDINDIHFGVKEEVDFIAASFVRKAEDVIEIRRILDEYESNISIIAKIENRLGVSNAEEILEAADGLMVARGDLGVEIPAEEVPLVQKLLVTKCRQLGKPVIIATQMLDSMQNNPRPTRAEASDVANAIFDGTDAIMLSGETAAGKFPVESVETMDRIARKIESSFSYLQQMNKPQRYRANIVDAMGQAVTTTSSVLEAAAILTPTESGYTAKVVSKYRPKCPVVAITPHLDVVNNLLLVWGVYPIHYDSLDCTDELMNQAIIAALEKKTVKQGDLVVITAGLPIHQPGTTNIMKVVNI